VKKTGITIKEFQCLAVCNGAQAEIIYPTSTSLELFRSDIKRVCSQNGKEEIMVVSYSRKQFGQTGDGHFSPIGGYNENADAVLIMDVARFKYPPHWVSVPALFQAMEFLDPSTGICRGYVKLTPATYSCAFLFLLRTRKTDWDVFYDFFKSLENLTKKCSEEICDRGACCLEPVNSNSCGSKSLLQMFPEKTIQRWINTFFGSLPSKILDSLDTFEDPFSHLDHRPEDYSRVIESIVKEVKKLQLFKYVRTAMDMVYFAKADSSKDVCMRYVLATILFLSFPCCYQLNGDASPEYQDVFELMRGGAEESLSEILSSEVHSLRKQIVNIIHMHSNTSVSPCGHVSSCKHT